MRIILFCHSLLSDWNHGNAHFLRGVVTELAARGHDVQVFEPRDAWSVENLVKDHGPGALDLPLARYPLVRPIRYDAASLDLDAALDGARLVLVHEWNDHALVREIGAHRAKSRGYRLLFHDTHHRSVTDPESMAKYDLRHYDGVLAFGEAVRAEYVRRGWASRAFVWHEAADVRVFAPPSAPRDPDGDIAWIGNFGDEERTRELHEFLLGPARDLRLAGVVHGVRYPESAISALADAGLAYGGWLPNFRVPEVLARHRVTVHVPRRPYAEALPGIPTIRVFEALACGAPLVSAPWTDSEGLFTPGLDYLVAKDGQEMRRHLSLLVRDKEARAALARAGRATILARHTCAHRVDQLLSIAEQLGVPRPSAGEAKGAFA